VAAAIFVGEFLADVRDRLHGDAQGAHEGVGAADGDAVGGEEQGDEVDGVVDVGDVVEWVSGEPLEEFASGGVVGRGRAGLLAAAAVGVEITEWRAGGVNEVAAAAVAGKHVVTAV
jgi:hypothetical protein